MTNHPVPTATLVAPLTQGQHQYLPDCNDNALIEIVVGRDFDRDFCPDTESRVLLQFPRGLTHAPGAAVLIRQWLAGTHPRWTYLSFYNVTGAACPVGGYTEANTPF